MALIDRICNVVLGYEEPTPDLKWLANAFAEGEFCDQEYARMRGAYARVCSRLGEAEEDSDLDTMVDAMEKIQKKLCRILFFMGCILNIPSRI